MEEAARAPEGDVAAVAADHQKGARLATEHLLAAGHALVTHVGGPPGWYETAERLAGWRGTLERAGVDVPVPLPGDWSPASGFRAGRALAGRPEVTAVFAANDQTALGLLRALGEQGRRVPEDVSIVGFDDLPEAGYFSPPLTTVRQDFAEVGRQSLHALLAQVSSGRPSSARVVITPELVVRCSTASPPDRTGVAAPGSVT